ncbi:MULTISPECIES: histidine--tRNA ligase [Hungatella]|uniref:Histidine--tRNA ligase n=1 Tax=Hungatella hathewayi TaxID=154046 RepID=A0AA37JLB0_9FIRM|nr:MULTISPECIES: histidine--tRNA ligase [Hungatella]MBT9798077.1 histidine--tRNA ligase [Hungatella hathewayi]MCI6453673.1 histidine--tRNA ligase [Hungatella sp.]RGZ03648.1 histidine--tRNA ligase [Hungatella hathewayi]GKH00921.1 histidine--tRNA ligase [Hungatella hathewayi]GKH10396.1 histidine--tRNA ligase [Hungatella hathewayi]
MALKKKPVTGMKDILPAEMAVRDYVMNQIRETYRGFGFTSIETPCVEHIENLTSKQGGDNEKLIFKIMKRGEKLRLDTAETENDLTDSGLRYDLTVPLCRYYANNAASLPAPFKALQMGSVWRADKPQRGRFRQFVQCDIDILGDPSRLAEIELILATTTLLGKVGFKGYHVRINDRNILKGMAAYCGFPEESFDQVFIILDKMDKIGMEGVASELSEAGYEKDKIDQYLALFGSVTPDAAGVRSLGETLKDVMEPEKAENLAAIMDSVNSIATSQFDIIFDPTLVRGMSYYTGTIYEIQVDGFPGSVGGGGRYDKMIGKFTGMETPACGFSIGFERIITILMEEGFTIPGSTEKKAFLIEKGVSAEVMTAAIKEAMDERARGVSVLVSQMNKNKKFQKENLQKEGYTEFKEFYREGLK